MFTMDFSFKGEYNRNFVGREKELKWLDEHLIKHNNSFSAVLISGLPGVGKTTLLKQWFASRNVRNILIWWNLNYNVEKEDFENLIIQIESHRLNHKHERLTIVIDDADMWMSESLEIVASRIYKYKVVSSLVFIRRRPLRSKRIQHLVLNPLTSTFSGDLLRKLLSTDLTDAQIENAIAASYGFPLALSILSKLISEENVDSILSMHDQILYDVHNNILIPRKELIAVSTPIIVNANHKLIDALKGQPEGIRNLTPREFEELLASLLRDMGWDVELTKQTRDGGADILAYLDTEIGRLLCLVEAKHYREDRKIGVDLVRNLYGTLCDAQANSAMLVTSSTFTSDARVFEQRHKYQLTLRDYSDVTEWIRKFSGRNNNFA